MKYLKVTLSKLTHFRFLTATCWQMQNPYNAAVKSPNTRLLVWGACPAQGLQTILFWGFWRLQHLKQSTISARHPLIQPCVVLGMMLNMWDNKQHAKLGMRTIKEQALNFIKAKLRKHETDTTFTMHASKVIYYSKRLIQTNCHPV